MGAAQKNQAMIRKMELSAAPAPSSREKGMSGNGDDNGYWRKPP